jgi:hypothetical protein
MQQLDRESSTRELAQPEFATVTTTLGELISTINEEVEPQEDRLVAEIVLHLLETRRIRFLNTIGRLAIIWTI